jgi:hypothetical protein
MFSPTHPKIKIFFIASEPDSDRRRTPKLLRAPEHFGIPNNSDPQTIAYSRTLAHSPTLAQKGPMPPGRTRCAGTGWNRDIGQKVS